MKALVLAGGMGTRLRPLTYYIAKQLVPVANLPILNYVMKNIEAAGIKDVGVIISPETGVQIKKELSKHDWRLSITYILQEQPLGLAHTVLVSREYLGEEPFVMYLGDNLIEGGIKPYLDVFHSSAVDSLILLKQVSNPSEYGIAEINGNGNILSVVEKPEGSTSNYAVVGIYVFSPLIHDAINKIAPSDRGELEITDAVQFQIDSGKKVGSVILDSWWLDAGEKNNILEANRVIIDNKTEHLIKSNINNHSSIIGRVSILEGCEIENSVIKGPAVIGRNVKIINSSIGPYSSIGDNCVIEGTELEDCVIIDSSILKNKCRIENSIVGNDISI